MKNTDNYVSQYDDNQINHTPFYHTGTCSNCLFYQNSIQFDFSSKFPSRSLVDTQWRRQDFLLEGQNRTGSGAEPQKIFLDHALYLGYRCDQRPFQRLK